MHFTRKIALALLLLEPLSLTAAVVPKALVAFAAKGTDVGIDGGFMHALYENYPALRDRNLVVSGSSSGSILAAIFGCHGLNDVGLRVMDDAVKMLDKKSIDMDPNEVLTAIFTGRGDKVFQPQSNLDRIISLVTDQRTCVPRFPMVIVAANRDVLDSRQHVVGTEFTVPFSGASHKRLHMSNYAVTDHSWRTGRDTYLGRACTYFVDNVMFAALSRVPGDQRLCDLRLIRTSFDMEVAIRASVSEPTYFPAILEPHPEAIVPATFRGMRPPPVPRRIYNGGYPMTIVAQDIKRVMPEVFAFGTGRAYFDGGEGIVHSVEQHLGLTQSEFIKAWYLIPLNEALDRARWWLDAEIPYSEAEWTAIGESDASVEQNVALGYRKTMQCLREEVRCVSQSRIAPAFPVDATGNIPMSSHVRRSVSWLKQMN